MSEQLSDQPRQTTIQTPERTTLFPVTNQVAPIDIERGTPINPDNLDTIIETNVVKADLIVLGNIVALKYEKAPENKSDPVYTIFTLTPEKIIKGDPATGEAFIKLPGGIFEDEIRSYEVVPSHGYFNIGDRALLCLVRENSSSIFYEVMIPLGTLWAKLADGNEFILSKPNGERLTLEWMLGTIIKCMRKHKINLSLPLDTIYPEPVTGKPPPTKNTYFPSEAAVIEDVVLKADLVVTGEITSQKSELLKDENGETIYTFYTLTIDKTIKGDPDKKEVLIKVQGGNDGEIFILQTSGPILAVTDKILICLQNESDNTYDSIIGEKSDGMLWISSSVYGLSVNQPLDTVIGWVILAMKKDNIPIVLPQKDWPFLPAGTTKIPPIK